MKELILDLRLIDTDVPETFADSPDRIRMETVLLDYAGKLIRIRIWEVALSRLITKEVSNGK